MAAASLMTRLNQSEWIISEQIKVTAALQFCFEIGTFLNLGFKIVDFCLKTVASTFVLRYVSILELH